MSAARQRQTRYRKTICSRTFQFESMLAEHIRYRPVEAMLVVGRCESPNSRICSLFTISNIRRPLLQRRRIAFDPEHATSGGARRDRTDDLLLAKQALSQLSYGPDYEVGSFKIRGGPGTTRTSDLTLIRGAL